MPNIVKLQHKNEVIPAITFLTCIPPSPSPPYPLPPPSTQVGKYTDDQIELLVPLSELQLDPSVAELFHKVFRRDHTQRPTALQLLNHPQILDGERWCDDDVCGLGGEGGKQWGCCVSYFYVEITSCCISLSNNY